MPSDLPIITPDPPRRSQAEKYGGLYYLGLFGLVVVVGLVTWFAAEAWSMRQVFGAIYVLHDATRTDLERNQAAYDLTIDPNVTQRQYWDMAFRTPLPPLSRYLLAESLTAEAVSTDPRGYALAAARSEGWPDWFRLLIVRPLAYAAGSGITLPGEPLEELRGSNDPAIRLWATYVLAAQGDRQAHNQLVEASRTETASRGLASLLLQALEATGRERDEALDRATLWIRDHHPEAITIWKGWEIRDGQLFRRS